MSKKYYKCLRLNRASWYDVNFIWSSKNPVEIKEAVQGKPCGIGLHLAKSINDSFKHGNFPAKIFEVKPLSPILGEDKTKIRVARAKLLKDVTPDYVLAVNRFLASISKIKWFGNHRPLKAEWQIFDTMDTAWSKARNTAKDAFWSKAWNTAWNAACSAVWNISKDTARNAVKDAAKDAAWNAASSAVWNTGKDIVWSIPWNAAKDAALYAQMLICLDFNLEKRHIDHIKACWETWKRGYGLLCDVNGTLYVYRKP